MWAPRKSTNIPPGHEVGGGCGGGGVVDPPLHSGGIYSFRAVPGAKIHHFKKNVNTGEIFRATFQFKPQTRLYLYSGKRGEM